MTSPNDRITLGRQILVAVPKIEAVVSAFHGWLVEAAATVSERHLSPVVEDDRVVAVMTPIGRFELAQEFAWVNDELCARIIFFRAPSPLRRDAIEVYSVRIYGGGAAHFGPGPDLDFFEWDHDRDRWAARNVLRLAYELAVAVTQVPQPAAHGGKMAK